MKPLLFLSILLVNPTFTLADDSKATDTKSSTSTATSTATTTLPVKMHEAGDWFPPKLESELNLTDDQKKKLKDLKEKTKDSGTKKQDELKALKEALKEKMGSAASESELKKTFKELQSKRDALDTKKFEDILKVRAILTPEQRKKFANFQNTPMMGPGGGMPGKGMNPGMKFNPEMLFGKKPGMQFTPKKK